MRIRFLLILFTGAALFGCSEPALDPLPPGATVLAFGDSLTYGTGARAGAGYPELLAQRSGLRVINAGVPGEISSEGRERLPVLLSRYKPDLVLLVHGGNDTLRRLPEAQTRENLRAMIEASRRSGAQVAMLGVPGRRLTLAAPDYYGELAKELDVPIDTSSLPGLMRDSTVKADAVHFNAEGYRQMAEAVHDLLRSSGALR